MKMVKKILIGLLVLLVILQFVPVDRTVPEDLNAENDLIQQTQASDTVARLLKASCYDCHSYETKYPWYSYTAPTKWFIQDHIIEGREHLNFSIWATYPSDKKAHKAEEGWEEVEKRHMPLESYLWMHSESKLNEDERKILVDYFKKLEKQY